jgi:hypothetical protein
VIAHQMNESGRTEWFALIRLRNDERANSPYNSISSKTKIVSLVTRLRPRSLVHFHWNVTIVVLDVRPPHDGFA